MISSPALQCQVSSKADLQGWLAQTCHRLSDYQALVFPVQAGCCSPGRRRRGQVQKEEDSLPGQESGGLDGGTAFLGHLYKTGKNFDKINSIRLGTSSETKNGIMWEQFPRGNFRDLWHLRHWLQFWQLRTWIRDNYCYLTIKSDSGHWTAFAILVMF